MLLEHALELRPCGFQIARLRTRLHFCAQLAQRDRTDVRAAGFQGVGAVHHRDSVGTDHRLAQRADQRAGIGQVKIHDPLEQIRAAWLAQ